MLRASLEMAGYRVVEAASVTEALNQLTRFKLNVVVTALDLPGGGGYEFLQRMRGEPLLASVPVVALANCAEDTNERTPGAGHFQDYLIRGDREAMLRSIQQLASALGRPVPVGERVQSND
jgi:CheY-like chemotaxis protein